MEMENEVIEFDIEFGDDAVEVEHPVDDDEMVDSSSGGELLIPEGDTDTDLEPYEGMEFESEEAAKAFYNSYARRVGFSTRVSMSRRSRRDGAIIQRSFVCAKEGFRVEKERPESEGKVKRPRAVTRVGCKAMLVVKIQESGKWVASGFEKEHNHELVPPDKVHSLRSHRHVSASAKSLIDTLQGAGIGPSGIMSVLIKEYGGISNVGFTERDCRNYMRSNRQRTLGGDTQVLLDYLKHMQDQNPTFFYAVQSDDDQLMNNIFWADPKARTNYTFFGDTVTFDTTYRSNQYRLPFASFTGVNHHGQPVLFGCALLLNESEASFLWLFKTWLTAMSGHPPVSITTDHDWVIRSAITQVFPEARHRFCKWHIFKEGQEKLSHVYLEHPSFEAEFNKCVNLSESVEEFESFWLSLIERYDLREHEWLQAIYNARRQWIPVYLRDTFFAEMSITQRSDSMNSYFDGYVNSSTTLQLLVQLYEKALESRYEKEVKADYDTMNTAPVLKTPSPMEKQAAEVYTKKLFMKFQEELVETLTFLATKMEDDGKVTTYRVAKFGEDHKSYIVRLNALEMEATCSCQLFEFSGLLCRHVLTVFRVTNVLTLPSRYVLKRWTRNAKGDLLLENHASSSCQESITVRYNNLRHEALKFVDEGAKTIDTYNVAMGALQEAAKKVASVKNNGGIIPVTNGSSREDGVTDGSQAGVQWGLCQLQSASDAGIECSKIEQECRIDCGSDFTTCEIFKSRDAIIEWTRQTGKKNGFVIVIKASEFGGPGRKPRLTFACERNGFHRCKTKKTDTQTEKSRKVIGTKKCGCPFELKGLKLATDDDWELKVVSGVHNHPASEHLEGHSFAGRLSQEECSLLVDMSKNMVRPKEILNMIKNRDPLNATTLKTIYNARQRFRVTKKASKSEMQKLLCNFSEYEYIEGHTTCPDSGYIEGHTICPDSETISHPSSGKDEGIELA